MFTIITLTNLGTKVLACNAFELVAMLPILDLTSDTTESAACVWTATADLESSALRSELATSCALSLLLRGLMHLVHSVALHSDTVSSAGRGNVHERVHWVETDWHRPNPGLLGFKCLTLVKVTLDSNNRV